MGAYFTKIANVGVTNGAVTTVTHSLGIAPANLVARAFIHQPLLTCTAPLIICTVGTNTVTLACGVGTLVTCDVEVTQIHSFIA